MIAELEELEEFRQEVRGWCGEHVPADWVRRMTGVSVEESLDFQRAWLAEQRAGGFAAPHWSAEWTGRGFTLEQQIVIAEEMARARRASTSSSSRSITPTACSSRPRGSRSFSC